MRWHLGRGAPNPLPSMEIGWIGFHIFKKKYDVHIYWFWCILTAASGDHGVMHAATDIQLFLASEKYSYKLLWIL